MNVDDLAIFICKRLIIQGLEVDNLGDFESIVIENEFPVINLRELAEDIVKHWRQ